MKNNYTRMVESLTKNAFLYILTVKLPRFAEKIQNGNITLANRKVF